MKYPTVEAVLAIHAEVLLAHGGGAGLRSRELLESAVEPIEIAAAYLFYLCSNHAFVDSNKRVALATCLVFLSENNLLKEEILDVDAWENLTLAVAAGALSRHELTMRLRQLVHQGG